MENNQSPISSNQQQSTSQIGKFFIIIVVIIGFITAFAGGYFLSCTLSSEKNVTITGPAIPTTKVLPTTVITSPYLTANNPEVAQDTTKFLPGKHYFDDTILLITRDKPRISLIATVTRAEQDGNYAQSSRVSYFDGSNWTRQSNSKTISDSTIVSNSLVKSWSTTIDPSRVLKQTAQGEITINNTSLSFSTGLLQNEIGMRSIPGYTKFMSQGTGVLKINGVTHDAYILYTRIYSLNASDIQFYNQPFGLTTDWIAFWDTKGNFYHVDVTNVDKPTQTYQTHQIAVIEDTNGSVTKTFNVSVQRDEKNPPTQYSVSLNNPIGVTMKFNRINANNKAPNGSYTWYMGNIEGSVQKSNGESLQGVGVVEYIHD